MRHRLAMGLSVLVAAALWASPGSAQQALTCTQCHGELELLRQHTRSLADARALLVPDSLLDGTAHAGFSCSRCHTGFDRFPHPAEAASQTCASCHEDVASTWREGAHAAGDGRTGVDCRQCHTTHQVARPAALEMGGDAMPAMVDRCIACHETQRLGDDDPHAGEAPCYACHAPHAAMPPDRPESRLSPASQPRTCGACHDSIASAWQTDVHGLALKAATAGGGVELSNVEVPTCTACHGAHPTAGPSGPHAAELTVQACARCHEEYAESFADSYHGQATTLGSTATATCADCHGAHQIHGADNPQSTVAPGNLVSTCRTCHPDATASFAKFDPHANPHEKSRNPLLYWAYKFMTWLLVGTMAMFGLHTLLWLLRIAIDTARGKSGHGYRLPNRDVALDAAQRGRGRYVWRFRLYHRLTHAAVIISFFLLVFTGMPLRFSCAPWSAGLMHLFGGVHMAGLLHRVGATITFGYFAAHLFYLIRALIRAPDRRRLLWGPDSIVPHPQDITDFTNQFRWFLGLGPRPRFARYSYMEKFDYFAVFWGVAIIGGTGLMLWLPELFAGFVPGWFFNVATVVHGDEAMLATLFIFTIHFFNVHLRPEKFPLDAVMFTGRATVEYMEEEHPRILGHIEARSAGAMTADQEQDAPAPPPNRRQTLVAAILGFLALGLGLLLIGMMTWVSFC